MTDTALAAPSFAESEFRIGSVMSKTIIVLSRNLLTFCIVTAIANLPHVLLINRENYGIKMMVGALLSALSWAILIYVAFEDMRGRPVDLMTSFGHVRRRFLPVIGTFLLGWFALFLLWFSGVGAGWLTSLLLVVPVLMFLPVLMLTMWFVAIPACVVEQLGPLGSLRRSAALTKGHRWKVFGMLAVLGIASIISGVGLDALDAAVGTTIGRLANLIWNAGFEVFCVILIVVTYYDLRVAKEGFDTDRTAAVFE